MVDHLAAMEIHGNSGEVAHLILMVAILAAMQYAANR